MCAAEVRNVFISSTTRDLWQYREVATEVLRSVSDTFTGRFVLAPVSMDNQSQTGDPTTPLNESRAWVRDRCDWVLLIVAWNYGCVPAGETRSVTENEYEEALAWKKPCFVFLPGELSDAPRDQYRALERNVETVNLVDWRGPPDSPDRPEGLARFKQKLRGGLATLFCDIQDFRAKLQRALSQRIISELFQTLGPEIVDLGLQPPLQACIHEVKLLARLKRMHDALHRIRQFGVRTWREELVADWPDDGEPSRAAERKYNRGLSETLEQRGTLKGLAQDLPPEVKSALPMDELLGHQFLDVPDCGKEAFVDSVLDFATYVQLLFTGCDNQMKASARRLRANYDHLAEITLGVLDRRQIPPERETALRAELQRSIEHQNRLQDALSNHNDWQAVHDDFERIDDSIEDPSPGEDDRARERRLNKFRRSVAALLVSKGSGVRDLLSVATTMALQDTHGRLGQWPELILKVGSDLDAFLQTPDVERYETMRKDFDDLFFQIDEETLAVVVSAEDRVRAIELGLQGKGLGAAPGSP